MAPNHAVRKLAANSPLTRVPAHFTWKMMSLGCIFCGQIDPLICRRVVDTATRSRGVNPSRLPIPPQKSAPRPALVLEAFAGTKVGCVGRLDGGQGQELEEVSALHGPQALLDQGLSRSLGRSRLA